MTLDQRAAQMHELLLSLTDERLHDMGAEEIAAVEEQAAGIRNASVWVDFESPLVQDYGRILDAVKRERSRREMDAIRRRMDASYRRDVANGVTEYATANAATLGSLTDADMPAPIEPLGGIVCESFDGIADADLDAMRRTLLNRAQELHRVTAEESPRADALKALAKVVAALERAYRKRARDAAAMERDARDSAGAMADEIARRRESRELEERRRAKTMEGLPDIVEELQRRITELEGGANDGE